MRRNLYIISALVAIALSAASCSFLVSDPGYDEVVTYGSPYYYGGDTYYVYNNYYYMPYYDGGHYRVHRVDAPPRGGYYGHNDRYGNDVYSNRPSRPSGDYRDSNNGHLNGRRPGMGGVQGSVTRPDNERPCVDRPDSRRPGISHPDVSRSATSMPATVNSSERSYTSMPATTSRPSTTGSGSNAGGGRRPGYATGSSTAPRTTTAPSNHSPHAQLHAGTGPVEPLELQHGQ